MDTLFSFTITYYSCVERRSIIHVHRRHLGNDSSGIQSGRFNRSIRVDNLIYFKPLQLRHDYDDIGNFGREYLWRTFDASRNRPPYIIEGRKSFGGGKTIRLRALQEKDAPLMLEWMHDPEIQKGFKKNMLGASLDDTQLCIDSNSGNISGDNLHFAIVDDADEYLGYN